MKKIPVIVIAEAGVNHNGSLETAKQLVIIAAEAGADAIKFQTFKASSLASASADLAEYQRDNKVVANNQVEMLKRLELKHEYHWEIMECCRQNGIKFLSTPFDFDSLRFLVDALQLPVLKISSGEITNAPFLIEVAQSGKEIILSTGMSNMDEIEAALGTIAFGYINRNERPSPERFALAFKSEQGKQYLKEKITILQCTTAYPTPYDQINLRAMDALRNTFGLRTGISDHSIGIVVPIAAVARGAVLVEKHITLDKSMPGPDHKASLEPNELKAMIHGIRNIEQALGDGTKVAAKNELINMNAVRKSLVAARPIAAGEKFSEINLTVKRPGDGISPMEYWDWLGRKASSSFDQDELIK